LLLASGGVTHFALMPLHFLTARRLNCFFLSSSCKSCHSPWERSIVLTYNMYPRGSYSSPHSSSKRSHVSPRANRTGIHGFGYLFPLIRIAPFSAHKLIEQDTAVLHQAIIV
jgi:hypothetical protein